MIKTTLEGLNLLEKSAQIFLYNSLAHQNIVKGISYSTHDFWWILKSTYFSILFFILLLLFLFQGAREKLKHYFLLKTV